MNTRVRQGARGIVAVALAATGLLAAGFLAGPERFWPVALVQYVPSPLLMAPALIALAVSMTLTWPWRLGAVLAVGVAAAQLLGLEVGRSDQGSNRLRLMTWNVKDYITLGDRGGLAAIASEIARHDPDILALQDARALARIRESNDNVRAMFANRQTYSFGQYVVVSRFPLRDCTHGEITFREQAHSYVSCTVTVGTLTFDLFNVHLITPRFGLSATREDPLGGIGQWTQNVSDRMTQASRLATDLRLRARPVIVAGDLNAPDSSLVVRTLLETGLRDAFASAGHGFGYTWGHSLRFRRSFLRIDHILVGPAFGVANSFTGGTSSAHRPVIADLYLHRAAQRATFSRGPTHDQ